MTDVIVIGGGPAGSTAAALLAQKGHSVLLLEKEKFPRFQIGESLLPYNNDLFRRLGLLEKLGEHRAFPKYGAEFLTGDGKIGHRFRFGRHLKPEYRRSFQVRRSEFDELLLRNAETFGVDVRESVNVTAVDLSDPSCARVTATDADGAVTNFDGRFVIDASGHSSVIGSRVGRRREEASLRKIAFFGHYHNVAPSAEGDDAGNTVIVILRNAWFWLIPISDEVTSVGLVIDRRDYLNGEMNGEALLDHTIATTPYVTARMENAERVTEVYARKDFSYWMERMTGPNFALIGDAAGFFDPIFSTGVFMAMKTADIAASATDVRLRTGSVRELARYERSHQKALKQYLRFIAHFYRREFLEVFLQPSERFGLMPAVVGMLGGDVFEEKSRWRLSLFFLLTRLQKLGVIAPGISWDTLPFAARS